MNFFLPGAADCPKFALRYICTFKGEEHVNPMEFNVTVEYPPVILKYKGPENLFDGDALEFDHSIYQGSKIYHLGTISTPQR